MKKIYLAGGCFWGLQAYFSKVKGIVNTTVGYANGKTDNTSYKEISQTDHAETLLIEYDENVINLAEIYARFLSLIDPYSINKQGNDVGRQYRTGIYYIDNESYLCAKLTLDIFEKQHQQKTVIELEPLNNFIDAEQYHQNYLDKNPGGYCHINLDALKKPLYNFSKYDLQDIDSSKDNYLKTKDGSKLDNLSYEVMVHKHTEKPFSSEFEELYEDGLYVDKISGEPLFSSEDKYDAGCGWPSFTKPILTTGVNYNEDLSHSMIRTEVVSTIQDSHLGHVFNDGPKDKGNLRYCINGASLRFIKLSDLENTPYECFLPYFKKAYLK